MKQQSANVGRIITTTQYDMISRWIFTIKYFGICLNSTFFSKKLTGAFDLTLHK